LLIVGGMDGSWEMARSGGRGVVAGFLDEGAPGIAFALGTRAEQGAEAFWAGGVGVDDGVVFVGVILQIVEHGFDDFVFLVNEFGVDVTGGADGVAGGCRSAGGRTIRRRRGGDA